MARDPAPAVRPATPADAALLAELGERTFRETFAADNRPQDLEAYLAASFSPARQAVELAEARSTFWIAELDGVAIGYAQLRAGEPPPCVHGERPIELVRLYVAKPWLGRGVGELLMRTCVETSRGSGWRTMWLGVWERNVRAQAFYRRWQFSAVGDHVFQLGSDPQRDLLMERALK